MVGHSDQGMRVLITGYSSFTGRYLKEFLERRQWRVFGIDHAASHGVFENVTVCDLLDKTELNKVLNDIQPHVVLHLAGISYISHSDLSEMYRVNIIGTRNLLEGLSQLPVMPRNTILAGSANIYGNTDGHNLDENTPLAPVNDYAVSKLAMEYMAKTFCAKLPLTIVRPFNYTGRGQTNKFVIPKIIDHFKRRESVIELGNIDVIRDFSDVRRVAESYVRLAELKGDGQIFNICSERGATLKEIIAMAEHITGHHIKIIKNPVFVRENEVKTLIGSCSKLESRIGSLPVFRLEETLAWMLEDNS